MSATPTNQNRTAFRLDDTDIQESESLRRIVRAPKTATLVEIKEKDLPHETIPKQVIGIVKNSLDSHEMSVGVIVNRVQTARETHRRLRKEGYTTHLVTGRMRPIDREGVMNNISRSVNPERESPIGERSFVVSTQAIESGADFSFDALITEASPADSLRQRLGRLDRRGTISAARGRPSRCWVLGVMSEMNPKNPDPVYGDATRVTWHSLNDQATDNVVDVGLSSPAFGSIPEGSRASRGDAPLLLPPHIDTWVQTNPEPVVQPQISEFLHGKQQNYEPDVSIVWRWDRTEETLRMVPPRPAEYLQIPISAARGWLTRAEEVPVADTDAPWLDNIKNRQQNTKRGHRTLPQTGAVRWTGRESRRAELLAPGDVIVADPRLGGITDSNWDPVGFRTSSDSPPAADAGQPEQRHKTAASTVVEDLGDKAQWGYGARRTLRLDPRLFANMPELPKVPIPSEEVYSYVTREETISEWLETAETLLPKKQNDHDLSAGWIADAASYFRDSINCNSCEIRLADTHRKGEKSYYLLTDRTLDTAVFDSSEDSSLTGTSVMLTDHMKGVGEKAADFALRLGLDAKLADDLRLAGELHDLGKADSRFQTRMTGNDPVAAARLAGPLAKSLPGVHTSSGEWPPLRHENGSTALVSATPRILEGANDPELVLHLISTHHGHSRPLPPIERDKNPQTIKTSYDGVELSVSTDQTDTDLALLIADLFWILHERYGHHGIAWLETIFRLAGWQRTAEEAKRGLNGG